MSSLEYSHKARQAKPKRGIECPSCGGTGWEVERTRGIVKKRSRRRVCVSCGQEVRTHEIIVHVYPREAGATGGTETPKSCVTAAQPD